MRIIIAFFLSICFSYATLLGQVPKITGTVDISLSSGKMTCDFCVKNLPKFEDLAFGINRGFNIFDVKYQGKSIEYNVDWGFPGRTAFLSDGIGIVPNIDSIENSAQINIKYTGAFPVYMANEEVASGDGMSVIAFKNKILRASHQSLWYPVIVDRAHNFIQTKYQYDVTITCKECESIYLGGSSPTKGKQAHFQTTQPNDLMLYAGKYKFKSVGNTYFLNANLSAEQCEIVNQSLDSIRYFYATITQIKDFQPIALAQIFSIGYKSQYEKWAFAVYPCIVSDLSELPKQIAYQTKEISDIYAFRIYSHELAHQFFGLKVKSDNEYWGFYSESFAEYMCLKAIEHHFTQAKYREFIHQRYLSEKALNRVYTHLDSVKTEIDNLHKYYYYPMLLLGLEKIVGQPKMFHFIAYILHHSTSTNLSYESFKRFALESGINQDEWLQFEKSFIHSDNCLSFLKERL